ncbi:hypothetical protein B566_EDAN005246, partial [Ephemera danica]
MVGTQEVFRDESLDSVTPLDVPLTARYKRSFAYSTIKDRLPVIITRVVDHLYRDKLQIVEEYGEDSREQLKEVIGGFSRLRNELQTNKLMVPLTSDGPDVKLWNSFLQETEGEPRWFHSPWLLAECYMYRRIRQIFEQRGLGEHLTTLLAATEISNDTLKKELFRFIRVALWGNKCDLSISGGESNDQKVDPVSQLESLEENILVNHLDQAWEILSKASSPHKTVELVLDNAGFELFTDLCLAELLVRRGLADTVRIHVKPIPWFVSDVTVPDLHWTLEQLATSMPELAERWQQHLQEGRWKLYPVDKSNFWTLPCDFNSMQKARDLNYRKLLGDLNWRPETPFSTAIRGSPRPLLTLRTLKSDVVSGLPEGLAERLSVEHPNWLISGDFAVIQ